MQGFFITGTSTEIGKTFVTALLTKGLSERGISACPVKPVASGGVSSGGALISEDALVYQRLAEVGEPLSVLSPFCLKRPASPHFAAELEAKEIPFAQIDSTLGQLSQRYDMLLVEGIGGWLVPLTNEITIADYAERLGLPVIVVSANVLGTLNHTLLTLNAVRQRNVDLAGVIFTHPSPDIELDLAENNIETVRRMGQAEILGSVPFVENAESIDPQSLWTQVKDTIQWERILQKRHTQKNK